MYGLRTGRNMNSHHGKIVHKTQNSQDVEQEGGFS